MGGHYDKETEILTRYRYELEGIMVKFNDRWCPGARISLYQRSIWASDVRELLYGKVDCPKELLWTPPAFSCLWDDIKVEYWADGYMSYEILATEKEVHELACRAEYDTQNEAHITVTRTLSIGVSTVWLKVHRDREYGLPFKFDVRLCVEFANSEECTRFLHDHVRELEDGYIHDNHSDVAVIDDIMHALSPISDDYWSAMKNAVRRQIPHSQLIDEYPRPETVLIRHRDSNRGHDRPCYLPCTLRLGVSSFIQLPTRIDCVTVDWGAINNFPTRPLPSDAFNSLSSLHLNFPSSTHHGYPNHDTSSQNDTDALRFTVEATGIHGLTATNSVAQGNSITIASEHRNVQVNLAGLHGISVNINFISGDSYFGAISNSIIGGTNNVSTSAPYCVISSSSSMAKFVCYLVRISSPVGSRSPPLTWSLPRRPTPIVPEQVESQGGVGRWVQPRPSRPRPY